MVGRPGDRGAAGDQPGSRLVPGVGVEVLGRKGDQGATPPLKTQVCGASGSSPALILVRDAAAPPGGGGDVALRARSASRPRLGLQNGESASGGLDRGPSGEEKYDFLLMSHLLQSRDSYCEPKEEVVLLK